MPEFCDVALPVPLDMAFTYRIANGIQPAVGGRVLVPFRQRRMPGVVVELHDREPKVQAKNIISALDSSPVLDDQLLQLGRWIANYYLAPLGEVFRSMLPLAAEFKHSINYRITDEGRLALHQASMSGSSGRSRRTPEEQLAEFRVLDYLSERDMAREVSLRAAARASKTVLEGMVRKRWIAREDLSDARDGARMMKFAILKNVEGRLNANQRTLIDTLAAAGGRISVEALRGLAVPRTTLATLVKRGGVEITEEPAGFTLSGLKARPSQFDFQLNAAQQDALKNVQREIAASTFSGILLHGVTGSGKTAVYLAAMKSVLDAGQSAILLVPEIGLTPAVAANLHQVFGDEVAILHSALSAQERAEQCPLPEVEIVEMRQEFQETGHEQVISRKLAEEIRERIEQKEQVMVLLNRRGYSPVVLCRACGKTLECKNCAIALTHHKRTHRMECHYCGHIAPVPKACVHCGSEYVYFLGTGSEKLEELLHGMFPQARIGRLDRDTVRGREDFERALNALNEGELDLLVGTQMIAKGHDVHGVTLVGVVGQWFEKTRHEGVRVLGPAAAPILRLKKDYRYHFVLKSPSREKLNALLRGMLAHAGQQRIPRTQVIVDVDAVWLM